MPSSLNDLKLFLLIKKKLYKYLDFKKTEMLHRVRVKFLVSQAWPNKDDIDADSLRNFLGILEQLLVSECCHK